MHYSLTKVVASTITASHSIFINAESFNSQSPTLDYYWQINFIVVASIKVPADGTILRGNLLNQFISIFMVINDCSSIV